MNTQPTLLSLDHLEAALAESPFSLARLSAALGEVEVALGRRRREVNGPGGALEEEDLVARPALRRRAERLRRGGADLLLQVSLLHRRAESATQADENVLRQRASALLHKVRHLRDSEAKLALESVETDLGAGD